MGWTCTEKPYDVKNYLDSLHVYTNSEREYTLLASALKHFNTYYAALKITDKETGAYEVVCSVILVTYRQEGGFSEMCYKEMGETCGPVVADCPEKILKLLTPTDNENANEWRERCWDNIKCRKKLSKMLKHGEKVTFKEPMKFTDGTEHKEMYVVRSASGRKVSFSTYRIEEQSPWHCGSYSISRDALLTSLEGL